MIKKQWTSLFVAVIMMLLLSTTVLVMAAPQSSINSTWTDKANDGSVIAGDVLAAFQDGADTVPIIIHVNEPGIALANKSAYSQALATTQNEVLGQLASQDFEMVHQMKIMPFVSGYATQQVLDVLANLPAVKGVYLDKKVTIAPGGVQALAQSVNASRANLVHQQGITGQGVRVAVLDTGIDTDHPDFDNGDRIAAQKCFTHNSCPGGGNEGDSAEDGHGHGTNVSGIVASSGQVSSVGYAPDAEIVAVKILDDNSSGYQSDWAAGLDWIGDNNDTLNVKAVNMSIGTWATYSGNCDSSEPAIGTATKRLYDMGIVIFACSQNFGSTTEMSSPACNSGVFAVGATYDSDLGREPDSGTYNNLFGGNWPSCADATTNANTIACFTNRNANLALLAPGAIVVSSGKGGSTSTFRGTSQASPAVAGTAALMLQANANLTPDQIVTAMKNTGTMIDDPGSGQQFPRIDSYDAVQEVSNPAPTPTTAPPTATATTAPPTATPTAAPPTTTPQPGVCTVYASTDVPKDLPNGTASISSNLSVSGSGDIQDVNVSVDMPHAWVGDLAFTLSHGTTSVTIIDRPGAPASTYGCSIGNILATLDDEATSAVENECARSAPAISGTFQPNEALSAFDGLNGDGTWTLQVTDAYTSADAGSLDAWSIEICTGATSPTPTPTSVPPTPTSVPPTPTSVPPTPTSVPPTPTQPPSGTMHVGDLDGAGVSQMWYWDAVVTVTVHDANHNPVSGATVSGSWNSASWNSSNQCTTNSSGQCQVANQYLYGNSRAFTVNSVSHSSLTYQAGSNHDPDGDSNGTTITVYRP